MPIADKLAEARKLIERGWTQGQYARSKTGRSVNATGKAAVCFCALGALRHVYKVETDFTAARAPLNWATEASDIVEWNDAPERTQAEVIEAFKRAEQIARWGEAA